MIQSEKVRQNKGPEFYLLPNFYKRVPPREQALEGLIYEHSTKLIITWIFTLFTNLKVKESGNWWLTRRILGFRQQKSDGKYLPMSVANIGTH